MFRRIVALGVVVGFGFVPVSTDETINRYEGEPHPFDRCSCDGRRWNGILLHGLGGVEKAGRPTRIVRILPEGSVYGRHRWTCLRSEPACGLG